MSLGNPPWKPGTLAEQEIADRARRRFERHLSEAKLPPGKTLANFDFNVVPMVSKAHVNALVAGDGWLDQGANLILVGPPGVGKSHLGAAIGLALIENGFRVLYAHTTDLMQKLQIARRELMLEAIDRLVHRATIFELNVESYRRRTAVETKRGRGRAAARATPTNTKVKLPGGASSKKEQEPENNP